MSYPIENKIVIAVASSALFDLAESDSVFKDKGEDGYRKFQKENRKNILQKGIAFPFIKRFLRLNSAYPDAVEVVLLSKNDPDTGLRVFESIKHYKLDIIRAGFLSGRSPYEYIPAFNASLFLSADAGDVQKAIDAGYAAGTVLKTNISDDLDDFDDSELRIAFDFDGVIVDDKAEQIYQKDKDLKVFQDSEEKNAFKAHDPGPLKDFFSKLSKFQKLERERSRKDADYKRVLRTAIVTARNAPAHERVVTTLNKWGVSVDEVFFMGGVDKSRILNVLKPHIYFDDQMSHLESDAKNIPLVHIPFGIINKKQ